MNSQPIVALIPIKANSQRLAGKNFLLYNGRPLYQTMLDTLSQVPEIEKVVVNTDSKDIADYCKALGDKYCVIERPKSILGDIVTMNTIIEHDLSIIEGRHFLQTHVTNPLLQASTISAAIEQYLEQISNKDSLFSASVIKKRVYDTDIKAINHSNEELEQTQDLQDIFMENSNLFIFSRSSFKENGNSRIGRSPSVFCMNEYEGIDIDHSEDLHLANLINQNRSLFGLMD
ncbi:MAG: acylneuraminate cytidylyltransferase family protein [Crocinitomicaceae bacterium]|nr:acylneuraminate cytidylyltransferase family protein [Crocinitomicaceae bacterium]